MQKLDVGLCSEVSGRHSLIGKVRCKWGTVNDVPVCLYLTKQVTALDITAGQTTSLITLRGSR